MQPHERRPSQLSIIQVYRLCASREKKLAPSKPGGMDENARYFGDYVDELICLSPKLVAIKLFI